MVEEHGNVNGNDSLNGKEDGGAPSTENDLSIPTTASQSVEGAVRDPLNVRLQSTTPDTLEDRKNSNEEISTESLYDRDDSVESQSPDSSMLNPSSSMDEADVQAISLLKQIFPEDSSQALRALHHKHLQAKSTSLPESENHSNLPSIQSQTMGENTMTATVANDGKVHSSSGKQLVSSPQSKLGRRIWRQYLDGQSSNMGNTTDVGIQWKQFQLPEDFLRLPTSVAVRRPYNSQHHDSPYSSRTQSSALPTFRYEFIADLHEQALQEYWMMINFGFHSHGAVATNVTTSSATASIETLTDHEAYYTVVIRKHPKIGLGLSLTEHPQEPNQLYVHGLITHPQNPCVHSGILPGDQLIGVNGAAFTFLPSSEAYRRCTPMQDAVQTIQQSPNPIVLHFARVLSPAIHPQASPTNSRSQTHTIVAATASTGSSISSTRHALNSPSVTTPNYPAVERNTSLLDADDISTEGVETIAATATSMPTLPTPSSQYSDAAATTESLSSPFSRIPRLLGRRKQKKIGTKTTPGGFLKNSTLRRGQSSSMILIHPFAKALAKKGLIRGLEDEQRVTNHLQRFTERTRQWESFNSLRIDPVDHTIIPQFDPNDLPVEMMSLAGLGEDLTEEYSTEEISNRCPPSTPPLSPESPLIPKEYREALFGSELGQERDYERDESQKFLGQYQPHSQQSASPLLPQYQGYAVHPFHGSTSPIFVPLFNVRKALSIRIVNTFVEESGQVAYTVWVYDVETMAKEWYAPVRYLEDFEELRAACIALAPPQAGVQEWDFPKSSTSKGLLSSLVGGSSGVSNGLFGARGNALRDDVSSAHSSGIGTPGAKQRRREAEESDQARERKCRQLEGFLRNLCSLVYTCEPLPPNIAEIGIHVQSFLGVEAGLTESTELEGGVAMSMRNSLVHRDPQDFDQDDANNHNRTNYYKKSERTRQELKMSLQRYTYRLFLLNVMKAIVHDFLAASRENGPTFQEIESLEHQGTLKSRATSDLERIQAFLDQMVDLILAGCEDDLRGIAQRRHYRTLHTLINEDESYWERLVREAVREQVEIEVYVPLRNVASRLLVNGWRHEDMEVQFKVRELRKRSQIMFRIPQDKVSPSDWQSVAYILKRGVGMSTLPCSKLRAIVEAAREISRLYQEEHGEESVMGADEFLPVFIFCVVRADMERPCALTFLLQTLCDRMNRIGEIGYFLASFQAAISHIQGLDLTEDKDAMLPFSTEEIPMTEVSLRE